VFKPYATTANSNPNGKSEWVIQLARGGNPSLVVEWGEAYAWGVPLVGDFLGDTKDEIIVVNPSQYAGYQSTWHVLAYPYNPATSEQTFFAIGEYDDIYLTCKVPNPSGKATRAAVYRPSSGQFIVRVPEVPGGKITSTEFGKPGDVPMCMDVDQNGTDEFVLWRPGERTWYRSNGSTWTATYVSTATEDSYAIAR